MSVDFWTALRGDNYDPNLGWPCTALGVPGATLIELRMDGETVTMDKVKFDSSHIRFVVRPSVQVSDAVAKIRLEKRLITVDTTIIAALIALVGTLTLAYVSYINGKKIGRAELTSAQQVDIDKRNTVFVPGSTLEAFIKTGSLEAATASIVRRSGELNDAQIVLTPKTLNNKSGICLQLNVTSPPGYQAAGDFSWRLAIFQPGASKEPFRVAPTRCDAS